MVWRPGQQGHPDRRGHWRQGRSWGPCVHAACAPSWASAHPRGAEPGLGLGGCRALSAETLGCGCGHGPPALPLATVGKGPRPAASTPDVSPPRARGRLAGQAGGAGRGGARGTPLLLGVTRGASPGPSPQPTPGRRPRAGASCLQCSDRASGSCLRASRLPRLFRKQLLPPPLLPWGCLEPGAVC